MYFRLLIRADGRWGVNGGGKTSQVAAQMSTTLLMAS